MKDQEGESFSERNSLWASGSLVIGTFMWEHSLMLRKRSREEKAEHRFSVSHGEGSVSVLNSGGRKNGFLRRVSHR